MPIVGNLPSKKIAYAAFDTFLYLAKVKEMTNNDKEME